MWTALGLLILKNLPTFIRWGDELHAAWTDLRERLQRQADDNRAATLAARQDSNAADLNALRRQAEQDAIAAAATQALLTAKAKAASEQADAPPKQP